MSGILAMRLGRFGVFTNKRVPPIFDDAVEALKDADLASKIEENAGNTDIVT
jgi:hypothetical protein